VKARNRSPRPTRKTGTRFSRRRTRRRKSDNSRDVTRKRPGMNPGPSRRAPMSQTGQHLTSRLQFLISAISCKADIRQHDPHVGFGSRARNGLPPPFAAVANNSRAPDRRKAKLPTESLASFLHHSKIGCSCDMIEDIAACHRKWQLCGRVPVMDTK
jgi:hypothetical protein